MLSWCAKPATRERDQCGNSDQHGHAGERDEHESKMPEKIPPARTLTAGPPRTDTALLGQNAVKQDEPHDAADIHQDNDEDESCDCQNCDQSPENRRIEVRKILCEQVL